MSEPPSVEQDQRKAQEAAQAERTGAGDSTHERVKEGQKRAEDAGLPQAPPEPKTV